MAYAGPGTNIRVRIHFKNGSTKEGIAKWSDDRAHGPAIVIPDKKDPYNEGVIPLGGQTLYDTPPRISSSDRVGTMPITFGEIRSKKLPTNPNTDDMRFEVIEDK